MTIIGQSS